MVKIYEEAGKTTYEKRDLLEQWGRIYSTLELEKSISVHETGGIRSRIYNELWKRLSY